MSKYSCPGWMIQNDTKRNELAQTCELSEEEIEIRKGHIWLMRNLIDRFKDEHKDYTEEWHKTDLEYFRRDSTFQDDQFNLTENDSDASSNRSTT